MQDFIISISEFVIGFLGWFVSTGSGRFIVIFGLVIWAVISGVRFANGR